MAKTMDRVSRGNGFAGVIRYIFANYKASFLCASNVLAARDAPRAISKMGNLARRFRPDIKKPVWHQALRLPKGETISHALFREIAHEYMRRMGWDIDRHQYIAIVSDDPEGQHIHIVANRVAVDANRVGVKEPVYLGKNENLISTRVCHELEGEFKLLPSVAPEYVLDARGIPRAVYTDPKDRKAKKGELRLAERQSKEGNSKPLPRKTIQRILRGALAAGEAGGMAAFLAAAEVGGIRVLVNVASTGRVNGLSFESGGVPFKGSQVGDVYAWAALATTVSFDKTRDQAHLEARSLRHVSRDQLPPLGQPAQTTRLPAPPAAVNPIVIQPAAKEAADYVQRYQPTYRTRRAPAAPSGRGSLARGPSLDRLRSLSGGTVDVGLDSRHLDAEAEGVVSRDPQLQLGVGRGPHRGLRPGSGATGPVAAGGLTRNPGLFDEARLGQRIAALPDEPALVGQGVVVTVVVTIARALDGYSPKAGRWGTLYIRQADDRLAVVDTGARVKVAHVDADAVRAALAVAASKWQTLTIRGSAEFKAMAAREAVRLGLGDRIVNPEPELQAVIAAERARLATPTSHVVDSRVTPAPTTGAGIPNSRSLETSSRTPVPRLTPRRTPRPR